ncbi:MAG: alpha/beta hydrolase fold domain-containing protein [bacterium]
MASLQSKAVALFIKLTRSQNWKTAAAVRASIAHRDGHTPPLSIRQSSRLAEHQHGSHPYFTIAGSRPDWVIFYFHGGGYIHEIDARHWTFCYRLASETGATVVVPIYPLAPETNYLGILKWCDEVVDAVLKPGQRYSLTGDSAGGGLSLGLAMMRRDQGKALPHHLGLISPALDCAMENPEAAQMDDPWLTVEGIKEAGRLYAGSDVLDPYASPIRGDLSGLVGISTMVGTRDVLYPDGRKLGMRAEADCAGSHTYVAEDMIHVWPLLPIPEAKTARVWLVARTIEALSV